MERRHSKALTWSCWSALKNKWESCADFEPSRGYDGVEDVDRFCVDEEGDTKIFIVLDFIGLAEITPGHISSHDEK